MSLLCPLHRRLHRFQVLAFLLFSAIQLQAQTAAYDFSKLNGGHHVPVDKNLSPAWKASLYSQDRKPYGPAELETIGMPCGGIAAGQLYVRGDGTLANWWIANNAYNTGYGVDSLTRFQTPLGPWNVCYKTFTPASYIDQGFLLQWKEGGKTASAKLSKEDFDNIHFTGEYPIASIRYDNQKMKIPVAVEAEVYSPFIPMNARESATPGTILVYTLKNTSNAEVEGSLSGWLQNAICIDIAGEITGTYRNRVISSAGRQSVVFDMIPAATAAKKATPVFKPFEDFENGYSKWTVTGTAFGNAPVAGKASADQSVITGYTGRTFANSMVGGDSAVGTLTSAEFVVKDPYFVFRLGGGKHPGKTCINLLVNDKVVLSATGKNTETLEEISWDLRPYKGKKARIQLVDSDRWGWGHVNVDDLRFSNLPVENEKYYPGTHPYFGNMALSVLDEKGFADAAWSGVTDNNVSTQNTAAIGSKLNGAVGSSFRLAPGESKTIRFLLTWYFPNRQAYYHGSDVTAVIDNDWNTPLPTKAPIIGNMYSNWYGHSTEVADFLQHNYDRLSAATHNFHNTYYNNSNLPYWLTQRLLMPISTLATETCQWWANDTFWAWEGVGSCVGTCTHVWNYEQALAHFFPELERNIREKTDFGTSFQSDGSVLARNGWGGVLIDGHAGAVLKAYREYLHGNNDLFLRRNWDRIKRATEFIINEDANGDGLIEKTQANTYDIAFYGANTYVGSLYLAALKAAEEMAGLMNDTSFAATCRKIAAAGAANSVSRLWTGQYFKQEVDLKAHPEFQYADGCLSDQLFGQTWAYLQQLGYVYPKDKVRTTLQSIWKYNWAPDVAAQNKVHPPERTYASFGEPGLLICTWPFSEHMGEAGVRYRDEVWTGIEYQVATSMIYEDMIEEGLSLVRSVHDRYHPAKHNPWNEIECGDHYARAMASWGVMVALQDFAYNGPEKSISYKPRLQADNFSSFYTSAQSWGNIRQQRNAGSQVNSIDVQYGKLDLQTWKMAALRQPKQVKLLQGDKEIPVTLNYANEELVLHFPAASVAAGQRLTAELVF